MQGTVSPSSVASPSSVRLEASVSRPVTEISPSVMTAWTAASTDSCAGCGSTGAEPWSGDSSGEAGSAEGTTVIAVESWADVTLDVERIPAERARRAAGRDHLFGVLGEVPSLTEGQEDPEGVRPVLAILQHDVLADFLLGQRE